HAPASALHNPRYSCALLLSPPPSHFLSPSPPAPLPFFFFNDTAPTEIYTLSLHDALPIFELQPRQRRAHERPAHAELAADDVLRSEEHTSELQSLTNLVCRLLLEKKKKTDNNTPHRRVIERKDGSRRRQHTKNSTNRC